MCAMYQVFVIVFKGVHMLVYVLIFAYVLFVRILKANFGGFCNVDKILFSFECH